MSIFPPSRHTMRRLVIYCWEFLSRGVEGALVFFGGEGGEKEGDAFCLT